MRGDLIRAIADPATNGAETFALSPKRIGKRRDQFFDLERAGIGCEVEVERLDGRSKMQVPNDATDEIQRFSRARKSLRHRTDLIEDNLAQSGHAAEAR